MVTYKQLSKKPGAFKSMTGLTVAEFAALLTRVTPRDEAWVKSQQARAGRQRAPGGGRKARHALPERLLMTLVWLRLYVTGEAVGVLFGVDKSTVSRTTRPILAILRDLGEDTLGWPEEARALSEPTPPAEDPPPPDDRPPDAGAAAETPGAPSPAEAWAEAESEEPPDLLRIVTPDQATCPDYLAIIDATEQRTQRAQTYAVQKRYYSGKRQTHTIKTQIVVSEHGRIRHVADSVPGATHDLTLLRQSGVKEVLPEGVTVLGDTGYRGLQHDFPTRRVALPYRPKDKQRLTLEEKYHNHLISRIRVVVENTLCQLKHFQALVARFRHSLATHSHITRAIAGIVNWRFDQRRAAQTT